MCVSTLAATMRNRSRSIAEGKAMATAMDGDFVALPAAGHIAALEEPDPLSAPLIRWLERTPGTYSENLLPLWFY